LGLFNPATHVLNPLLRNPKHTPPSSYPPAGLQLANNYSKQG